jgi:hypothetical protein
MNRQGQPLRQPLTPAHFERVEATTIGDSDIRLEARREDDFEIERAKDAYGTPSCPTVRRSCHIKCVKDRPRRLRGCARCGGGDGCGPSGQIVLLVSINPR